MNKNKELITEDSLKFKEDYESVNGKKVSDELSYSSLDIPKNISLKDGKPKYIKNNCANNGVPLKNDT